MKKILSILIFLVFILFLSLTLFVFEIPPFNPGGLIIPAETTTTSQEEIPLNGEKIPDFLLEDKVGRAKTYDEHMNRAELLKENKYYSLAIAEYESASKLSPSKPDPLVKIGEIHLLTNDTIKAKLSLQEAIKLDPENIKAKILLTKAYIAERQTDDAKGTIDSIQVHNQESKYYQALLAAYTGDHEFAKSCFNEAINIGGNDSLIKNSQNFLAAYAEFDTNQGGQNTHLYTLLARSYNQTKEFELAIPLLFEVIREKKDYRDAWILLGYAYLSTQKYQDAVEALEEAKKLDPQKPETLFFLGLGYFGLGDLEKAAASLETAKKNGFEPQVQVDQKLAEIYLQLKEYQKSAESYEEVLSLNSEDVNYFIKPIWIYIERLNQPDKAKLLAQKALRHHPYQAMSYNLVGWANIGTGQFQEAESFLDKANAIDPDLEAVYLNYGQLYEKQGNESKAKFNYRKAYELGSGNSISTAAAHRYNNLIGKTDDMNYSLQADLLQ